MRETERRLGHRHGRGKGHVIDRNPGADGTDGSRLSRRLAFPIHEADKEDVWIVSAFQNTSKMSL